MRKRAVVLRCAGKDGFWEKPSFAGGIREAEGALLFQGRLADVSCFFLEITMAARRESYTGGQQRAFAVHAAMKATTKAPGRQESAPDISVTRAMPVSGTRTMETKNPAMP